MNISSFFYQFYNLTFFLNSMAPKNKAAKNGFYYFMISVRNGGRHFNDLVEVAEYAGSIWKVFVFIKYYYFDYISWIYIFTIYFVFVCQFYVSLIFIVLYFM